MCALLWVIGSTADHRGAFISAVGAESFPESTTGQRLVLDNKYYTAELTVVSIEAREVKESSPREHSMPDGIILLFSGGGPLAACEAETRVFSALGHDADVQLCVTDQGFTEEANVAEGRRKWAADASFEHVDVHSGDSKADAALSHEGEQQGFHRVREALSAHMWPGLRLKSRSGVATNTRAAGTEADLAAASSLDSSASDSPTAAEFSAFRAPAPESNGHPQPDDKESAEGPEYQPLAASAAEHDEQSPEDNGRFERLMQQLAGQRARLQSMSDEERRTGAAAAAEQMLQMFGLDDGSDSLSDCADPALPRS